MLHVENCATKKSKASEKLNFQFSHTLSCAFYLQMDIVQWVYGRNFISMLIILLLSNTIVPSLFCCNKKNCKTEGEKVDIKI